MMRLPKIYISLFCLTMMALPLQSPRAESAPDKLPLDKAAIEQIIHDYLLNNPDVLKEALGKVEAHAQAAAEETQRDAIAKAKNDIFGNKNDPIFGNEKGQVNAAYFFDYQCGYCKKMAETNKNIFTSNGKARVVLKDLPILGPDSMTAAKAALAAKRQGKYEQFHYMVMDARGPFNETRLMTIAATIGLDAEKLKKDMEDPAIAGELQRHRVLAQQLGINGTPAYLVEDTLIPGAISPEDLRDVINKAAEKKSAKP